VRRLLLALSVLAIVLVQAGGASGRESYSEWLTINSVALDGSKRVLSRHNVYPESSSLSPDQKQLAYAPYVSDGIRSKELWIADVNSPRRRLLVRAPGWITGVAWAPNGNAIALTIASSPWAPEPGVDGIWLAQADGSELHRVGERGWFLTWSPDSRHITFVRYEDFRSHIGVLDLDTGLARDLGEGQYARWSPHGTELVYEKVLGCDCLPEIRVMSVATGESRKVARGLFPAWSPDGERIAYTRAGRRILSSLWVVRSTGGKPRFVANRARTGVWSPNGRWMAVTRRVGDCKTALSIVPTRGGAPRRLAVATRFITPQAWTRSGRVLYAATRCLS
jgi:Tol biopolymer transport system component